MATCSKTSSRSEDGQEGQQEESQEGHQEEGVLVGREEDQDVLTEVEMQQIEEANSKWKTFISQVKQDEIKVKAITRGVPLESRVT